MICFPSLEGNSVLSKSIRTATQAAFPSVEETHTDTGRINKQMTRLFIRLFILVMTSTSIYHRNTTVQDWGTKHTFIYIHIYDIPAVTFSQVS